MYLMLFIFFKWYADKLVVFSKKKKCEIRFPVQKLMNCVDKVREGHKTTEALGRAASSWQKAAELVTYTLGRKN